MALTLTVALVGFGWTQSERRLDVSVLTDSALISTDPQIASSLTAKWKDQPVSSLRLLEINIQNNGSEAIRVADFDSPIALTVSNDDPGEFLDARATATRPPTMSPNLQVNGRRIEIAPLLLNTGDQISLRLVTTTVQPLAIRAEGRIAGVKDISLSDQRRLDSNGQKLDHGGNSLKMAAILLYVLDLGGVVLILLVQFAPSGDFFWKKWNVGVLVWPALISAVIPSYVFTLGARGISLHTSDLIVWVVASSLGFAAFSMLFGVGILDQTQKRSAYARALKKYEARLSERTSIREKIQELKAKSAAGTATLELGEALRQAETRDAELTEVLGHDYDAVIELLRVAYPGAGTQAPS